MILNISQIYWALIFLPWIFSVAFTVLPAFGFTVLLLILKALHAPGLLRPVFRACRRPRPGVVAATASPYAAAGALQMWFGPLRG